MAEHGQCGHDHQCRHRRAGLQTDGMSAIFPRSSQTTCLPMCSVFYFMHPRARMECGMDFIERWLGISPDGGDGSTELLYIIAFVVVCTAAGYLYVCARRNS